MEGTMRFVRILLFFPLLLAFWSEAKAQSNRGSDRLQPGDVVSITVYQDPKLDRQVLIGPTGMMSFPLAGQIRAGGLTPAALEGVLKLKLKDKFTEEPDVTVSLVTPKEPKEPKPLEE